MAARRKKENRKTKKFTEALLLDALGSDIIVESRLIARIRLFVLVGILLSVVFGAYYDYSARAASRKAEVASTKAETRATIALAQAQINEKQATLDRAQAAQERESLQRAQKDLDETLNRHEEIQIALRIELAKTKQLNNQLRNEIGAIADIKAADRKK